MEKFLIGWLYFFAICLISGVGIIAFCLVIRLIREFGRYLLN